MSRYKKYIKESYKYFQEVSPNYSPDADDIVMDVVGMIEEETGYRMDDEEIDELEKEVTG